MAKITLAPLVAAACLAIAAWSGLGPNSPALGDSPAKEPAAPISKVAPNGPAPSAPPTIAKLSLRGLQIGATTTLAIEGANLAPDAQIVIPIAIGRQSVRSGGSDRRIEIDVTLPSDAQPGIYNLRIATGAGVSEPALIGVDGLAQSPVVDRPASLPVAMSGEISGGQIVTTAISGARGEPIAIEVEARRLGGGLDPVIEILDERRVTLDYAEGAASLLGDARLIFTPPATGVYTVQMHDTIFQAAAPNQFRLKIGKYRFADTVFPLAVRRGATKSLELAATNAPPGLKCEVAMSDIFADIPAKLPADGLFSGLQPRVLASDCEQFVTTPPVNGQRQRLTAPAGVSGRIVTPGGENQYVIDVTPAAKLRLEVTAARVGSPLDAVLTIRDEKGNQLAVNDDQPSTVDPGIDFTVPAGATTIVASIKDVAGRGGADYVYHLAIDAADRPNFTLSFADDRVLVPSGAALLKVAARRSHYDGPIGITLENLPKGVIAASNEIPPGSDIGLVELMGGNETDPGTAPEPDSRSQSAQSSAASDSGDSHSKAAHSIARLVGQGAGAGVNIRRAATLAVAPAEAAPGGSPAPPAAPSPAMELIERQPWLGEELAISRIVTPVMGMAWSGVSDSINMTAGAKAPLSVKLSRGQQATGPLRISLVTTQQPVKKKVKVNNREVEQDDAERMLRVEPSPTIAADQSETIVQLICPADLPPRRYDIALRGELLSADGKTVVASTVTQIVRINVTPRPATEPPPTKLAGAAVEDLRAPGGATLRIFEDEAEFVAKLDQGGGQATLTTDDKFSGVAAIKVTPDQRFNPSLAGLHVKIRKKPGAGEYRYIQFAWKKKGGVGICLQLSHDGTWGPRDDNKHKFRYHAGEGPECFGASLLVDRKLPQEWTLVTRDLYEDFGEFTLDGIALSPLDGEYGLFDFINLGRSEEALDQLNK